MPAIAVAHVSGVGAADLEPLRPRLLAALCAFLPRVGIAAPDAFACDLTGTARLLGPAEQVGWRIVDAFARAGAECAVGIAASPFAALTLASRTQAREVRVLARGAERAFLAPLPLDALPLDPRVLDELALLGLRRIGDLAALPRGAVLDRFGHAAAAAHALACGEDGSAVRGVAPPRRISATRRWDAPLGAREQLVFALRTAVEEIAAALAADGLAALRLRVRLERDGLGPLRFDRVVMPPSADAAVLLRSIRWSLEESPPPGPVTGAFVQVGEVERARGRQIGLFAADGAHAEEALAVARHLRGRLGPGTVLRARIADADARFPERTAEWSEVVG